MTFRELTMGVVFCFFFWKCNFHKQNMRAIRDVMILFIFKKLTLKNNFS